MITDGLRAYEDVFKKEFFTLKNPRTKHVRMSRFVVETNNNVVKRLQVMKGSKERPSLHLDCSLKINLSQNYPCNLNIIPKKLYLLFFALPKTLAAIFAS